MSNRLSHSILFACLLSLPLLNACKKEPQRAEPVSQEEIQKKQDKIIADLKQKYPPKEETESSAPPPAVPIEESREAATHSGGLGLDLAAFEIIHGKTKECGASSPPPLFLCPPERDGFDTTLSEFNPHGNITSIYIQQKITDLVMLRRHASTLIPKDSQLIRTYSLYEPGSDLTSSYDSPIDLYHSKWLSNRFTETEWKQKGSEPGVFYVHYTTHSMSIDLGQPH